MRKVWGGSRTPAGANAQGALMSVLRTATQLGYDTLGFLSQTLSHYTRHVPKLILAAP